MKKRLARFPGKIKGKMKAIGEPLSWKYAIWGMVSGTVSIFVLLEIAKKTGYPLLVGSFGASAVLLFGVNESPLSQPRNLVGGHIVSAIVAIVIIALGGGSGSISASCAVGISIFLMYITRTMHPPGGATAFLGVQGHANYMFLFMPVFLGSLILLAMALFTNNIVHHRQYPKHWI
jgi:CBS-domain-containing membrane protein